MRDCYSYEICGVLRLINMAVLIKAPKPVDIKGVVSSLFLAGSIEEGKAEKWQDKVWKEVKDIPALAVLNPRRDDWDDSWKEEIENKKFREQVEWELNGLENVDVVAMYFDSKTKSPITLLELGILSHRMQTLIHQKWLSVVQRVFGKRAI
jgi:hypothetical protein